MNKVGSSQTGLENWYVLYTKSRQEKAVAKNLEELGLNTYCPQKRVKRRWSDRWKWVDVPLFSSYCFVRLSEEDRDLVFQARGVVQYVLWLGKPAVVRDDEINQIKIWLNDFDNEAIEVQSFAPGDRITVESGPLMDQKGEVITRQGDCIQLKLEELGVLLWVDASKNRVEKLIAAN